jgi:hypothetical protein
VLEDVRSHNNRRFGVVVAGKASLEARRLVIDRTQPDAVLGHDGRGLLVTTGGQAVVRSARVHANHAAGAECNSAGSSLTLHDGLIDATDLQYLDGNAGMSIFVHKDCALSVTGARLHASHFAGVGSAQTQVPFRLRGVLIDDTLLVESPQLTSNGSLLLLDSAGTSEVRSSRLVRSIGTSVFSFASLLDMSDTVIGEVAQHLFPGLPDASGFSRTYNELSDGVAGSQSLRYHGSRLLLYGHARAGMLLSGVPDALVERTVIRGGDFGLAWQDGTKLVDSFNAIVDAKQPRASDQGLAAAVPPPLVALHGKQ